MCFQVTLLENLQGTCDQLCRVLSAGEVANHLSNLFNATPVESTRNLTRAKLRAMKNAVNSQIFDDDGKIFIANLLFFGYQHV